MLHDCLVMSWSRLTCCWFDFLSELFDSGFGFPCVNQVRFILRGKPWIQLVLELVQWLVWVGSMVQADLVHCLFD